jgi:siroheme synthase (precorrin-2 oxidase/ferrochelatase)
MNGLYRAFRAKNVIFMSARFNEQHQRFLKEAYGVKDDQLIDFQTRSYIEEKDHKGEELDYEAEVNESQEYLVDRICERVDTESEERPVIIFEGVPDPELKRRLGELCKSLSIPFADIQHTDEAL